MLLANIHAESTPRSRSGKREGKADGVKKSVTRVRSMLQEERQTKKLLFVVDPLDEFKVHKDTTFSIMREAQLRGLHIAACLPRDIQWKSGSFVTATVQQISLTGSYPSWYRVHDTKQMDLKDFDAVLMRKDPPFNAEYIYATHLLEQVEREGGNVVNRPRSLRDHPEKLAIMEFSHLVPPTLVTRNAASVRDFHAEHGDIILKPLDGMGGKGIFRVGQGALNLGVIIETLNKGGAETIMVQRFVSQIVDGDKRILIINGEPVPFVLARIPQGTEVRGNLAVGGKGVAQPLTPRNREIAEFIGRALAPRGLLLIGLDVIGDSVTEINVTSPTGFQEITDQTGFNVPALFVDALERTTRAT